MSITPLRKPTEANEIPKAVTLALIADPLLNIDHNKRVPLTLNKQQCGTFIPLVLYMGMKLRYLTEQNLTEEPQEGVDKIIQASLRQVLLEIRRGAKDVNGAYYGKTLQEKVFRHLVYNEPLSISSSLDILTEDDNNKAHTVSHGKIQGENPSFTVPCYLCRYMLEKEGLNRYAEFTVINPSLKLYAKKVFATMKEAGSNEQNTSGSFSRRVQNSITLEALKSVFSDEEMCTLMKHPYY